MSKRLKGLLVAAACLACCIPLALGIFGATTGVAGAVSLWFRRYDLAVLAGMGLVATGVLVIRDVASHSTARPMVKTDGPQHRDRILRPLRAPRPSR